MKKSIKLFFILSLFLMCVFSFIISELSFSYARADVREGKTQSEDVVVMDSFDDYTSVCEWGAEYALRTTTITSINGKTSMGGGVSSFPTKFSSFWNPVAYSDSYDESTKAIINGTEDKKLLQQSISSWGFTVFNDVTFKTPVQLGEDFNTIIFRLYLHLSASETYCLENGAQNHGNLGIWIFGIGDTGATGEGVMIPFDVTQDEWINFEIAGDDAYKLADEKGVVKGFIVASGIIDNDKPNVFYKTANSLWIDKVSKGYRVTKPNRAIMTGNGDWSQTTYANRVAKSIEGVTAMAGGVTSFGAPDFSWVTTTPQNTAFNSIKGEAEDMSVIGHVFNGWGFTLSRVVSFVNPVSRSDVDAVTFRIAAHLSSGETYGIVGSTPPNGGTGIYFFAPDSDGSKGTGVLLPYDIKQEEWVDFTVKGEDLDKLTDSNGMISGFYIGAGVISENSSVLYSFGGDDFNKSAYLLIDSVKFNNKQTLTFNDGENVIKTQEIYTGEKPFYPPEKEGKSFIGWRVNNQNGRLLGANEEFSVDIKTLFAEWTDEGDIVSVSGLYTDAGGKKIMIFKDGSVKFDDGFGRVFYYSYGANGVLYVFTSEERLEIDLKLLSKVDSVEVIYMDGEFGDVTFFKTVIEKNTTAPNVSNENSYFEFWSKALGGRAYDFSEAVSEDTVLYAVNRYGIDDKKIITGNRDSKEGESWLLQSIGGVTSMNAGTATIDNPTFKFQFRINNYNIGSFDSATQEKWAGSDDGNFFSMLIGPWGYSIGKPILLKAPINVENYDSVTFRLFAHLSPSSPYGGELWGGAGIRIFGAHSDGSDSGILIPLNIEQDKWVDLTVGKELLNVLADEDGYMYGFTIGSAIVVDTSVEMGKGRWHNEFDWERQDITKSTYVLIDYITLSSENNMRFTDDDGEVLKTQSFIGGTVVDMSFVPEKAGCVFTGWTAFGAPLDYSEVFYQDVNLYANWQPAVDISTVNGLYTKAESEISVFKDGTVKIKGLNDVISYGVGTDGVLYVACSDGVRKFVLSEYDKKSACEVTVDDGTGNIDKYLVISGNTFTADFTKNGYIVDKIIKTGTSEEFVLGVDTVFADTELTVVWKYDEIDNYTDVIGQYYCSESKTMLELCENNVAIYDGKEYSYYLLRSDEIVIEGLKSGTFIGTYIALDGNFVKLGRVTVSFFTGRGNVPIAMQTLEEGSDYKATKPSDPQGEGLEFVCWTTADGQEFDFDTVITGSIQLFAKWNKTASKDVEEDIPDPIVEKGGCGGSIASDFSAMIIAISLCVVITFIRRRTEK